MPSNFLDIWVQNRVLKNAILKNLKIRYISKFFFLKIVSVRPKMGQNSVSSLEFTI